MKKEIDYNVVVLGEEHYNPLGVVRTLGEAGINPTVVVKRSMSSRITSQSRYIGELHFVDTYEEGVDWIVDKFCRCVNKTIIIPTDDIAVSCLETRYEELSDMFVFNNAGKDGRISFFQNKEKIYELADKHGMRIAQTWHVKKGYLPNDIEYPVITKPIRPYADWKSDYYVCNNEDELIIAYSKIGGGSELLLQRYVDKVTERTYEGCAVDKGRDVLFSIEARYTYTLPDYYSMEMVVSNPTDEDVGYEGIFEVEFMEDGDGKLWFLEINFRNSTWSWASTKVGMPLPVIWIKGMMEENISKNVIRKVPKGFRALAEQPDFFFRVRREKMISLFEWLKLVKTADCLMIHLTKSHVSFLGCMLWEDS